jgi:hypothetical protein
MADETTTTTESTTETTTEAPNQEQEQTQETATTTENTTVVSSEATVPAAEKQGEVAIDKRASADVVGDTDQKPAVDHIEQAKADALANHAAAEASQPETTTSPSDTAAE